MPNHLLRPQHCYTAEPPHCTACLKFIWWNKLNMMQHLFTIYWFSSAEKYSLDWPELVASCRSKFSTRTDLSHMSSGLKQYKGPEWFIWKNVSILIVCCNHTKLTQLNVGNNLPKVLYWPLKSVTNQCDVHLLKKWFF